VSAKNSLDQVEQKCLSLCSEISLSALLRHSLLIFLMCGIRKEKKRDEAKRKEREDETDAQRLDELKEVMDEPKVD
jgi:hypothetical protein